MTASKILPATQLSRDEIRQSQEIYVDDIKQTIVATRHVVEPVSGRQFNIWVDSSSPDEITQTIIDNSYVFPLAFQLLSRLIAPGQRVLDLGAHIGTFSLFAAMLSCEVVAIEASSINAALLKASAQTNQFDKISLVQRAITNRSGTLEFLQGGPYGLVKNLYINAPTVTVQASTVDELLNELGWERVDLVKMDIEGSEVAAVEGMQRLLSRQDAPPIFFESNGHTLHMFGQSPSALRLAIEAFGYKCYLVEPDRLIPVRADDFQAGCVVDYLAVKNTSQISSWPVSPPLSYDEVVSKIWGSATYRHPHIRAYVARALAQPNAAQYISNTRVIEALCRLLEDADDNVRLSAAWYVPPAAQAINHQLTFHWQITDALQRLWSKVKRALLQK